MAGKRVVLLRGHDHVVQTEQNGIAGAVIKPGYLVDGVNTIIPHGTAGGVAPRNIALERDEFGVGIDDTYASSSGAGAIDPDYQIDDYVKVAHCHAGVQFTGWIASGQTITSNDRMESAGNGSFRKLASGEPLARALETITSVELTTIKLEFL